MASSSWPFQWLLSTLGDLRLRPRRQDEPQLSTNTTVNRRPITLKEDTRRTLVNTDPISRISNSRHSNTGAQTKRSQGAADAAGSPVATPVGAQVNSDGAG